MRLAGGEPVLLQGHEEDDFLPSEAEIAQQLEAGAAGVILNSPCNPTGTVWPEERVAGLIELCKKHDAWILSDEIYAQILYDGATHVSPAQLPGGRERTVVLNGFSKAFSMTGWRIGYLAAPEELTHSVIRAQSQMIGNPCTPSQHAAIAALTEDAQPARLQMVEAFTERRAYMIGALPSLPGFTLRAPEGAFYLFPGVQTALGQLGIDDVEFGQTAPRRGAPRRRSGHGLRSAGTHPHLLRLVDRRAAPGRRPYRELPLRRGGHRMSAERLLHLEQLGSEASDLFLRLVATEQKRTSKGDPYLDLELADGSRSLPGKLWSNAPGFDEAAALEAGVVVKVRAALDEYRGQKQLKVLRPARDRRPQRRVESRRTSSAKATNSCRTWSRSDSSSTSRRPRSAALGSSPRSYSRTCTASRKTVAGRPRRSSA